MWINDRQCPQNPNPVYETPSILIQQAGTSSIASMDETFNKIDELLRGIDGGSMLALRRPPNCYIDDKNNGTITVK